MFRGFSTTLHPDSVLNPRARPRASNCRTMLGALLALVLATPAVLHAQRQPFASDDALDIAGVMRVAIATRDSAIRARPFSAWTASSAELRDSIVARARAQVGRRYRLGGQTTERGFDCSGLVRWVLASLDIAVPRTAAQQARIGRAIPRDTAALRPGDIVTFGSGSRITHIGIYVGEGRFVHASTVAGRVIETPLIRPRHARIKPWRGVRRIVDEEVVVASVGR